MADSLIKHLVGIDRSNEYLLYQSFGDHFFDPDVGKNHDVIKGENVQYGLCHRERGKAQNFWREPPHDFEQQLGSPDVIHANNFFCPGHVKKAKVVYTLYDLGFIENPEWTTEANRIGCFDGVFNASLFADRIIAISEYSRSHFLKIFPHYPGDRIVVVHLASRFRAPTPLQRPDTLAFLRPEKFWLNVGTLEPRKNHSRLLKAFAKLKAALNLELPLVIAGGRGWMLDNFQEEIRALDLSEKVILLGYVDNLELQWLYQNCFCMVYPSLFEGFGLPVLEAMSLGAPVIASSTSSIPEIMGKTGVMVDPYDEDSIFRAMQRFMVGEHSREQLSAMAIARAQDFSWKASAQKVLWLYQSLV